MNQQLIGELKRIIEDASGYSQDELNESSTFMELGFDSLLLTQVALDIAKRFSVSLTFRQLMAEFDTISKLSVYVAQEGSFTPIATPDQSVTTTIPINTSYLSSVSNASSMQDVINQQLEIMRQQIQLLSGKSVMPLDTKKEKIKPQVLKQETIKEVKATVNNVDTAFGAQARISTELDNDLSELQTHINSFMDQYIAKTKKSKEFTQKYRSVNADPRVVTGFRPAIKEIIYPLVVNRSDRQHLWDVDDNEYIDMICGFGSNFFGNNNPRITKAMHDQLERGFEIGPQHELVGECANLICEFTNHQRAAFCNTGSEAVLGALRMARAVTGKQKVIMFTGSYHGINDEVIVRGLKDGRAMPAAAGISKNATQDIILIEYGTEESYQIIEREIDSIAAVITESVQSRRPDFRPKKFLEKVRKLTAEHGVALIFDEVITGFRIAPGGAQEFYGIQADIATYGKIVGAGMPIGVIAGNSRFMDALDGGSWQYGDSSTPTVGVTYFAGTFVRHPLALRALREALLILKEAGQQLYDHINSTAAQFVEELNFFCEQTGAPIKIDHFGGVLKPKFTNTNKNNDLFYAFMRYHGVHVWDGFPWFITMAHSDDDLFEVKRVFKLSVNEMLKIGVFTRNTNCSDNDTDSYFITPPVAHAKLGKDENGNPAWFVEDEDNPGSFLLLERNKSEN